MATIGGEIIPLGPDFAALDDQKLRGSLRPVATIAARDALEGTDFDKIGMWVRVLSEALPAGVYERTAIGWDAVALGGGGITVEQAHGWIRIADVIPQTTETISAQIYQDAGNTIIQSATSDQDTIRVVVRSSFPVVDVNGTAGELALAASGGHYEGNVDVTVAGGGVVTATLTNPNGTDSTSDSMTLTVDAPPELTALSFVGGYPGIQTELKAGDLYQVTGTTDKNANAIEIANFEASDSVQVLAFADDTTFTVTMVVGTSATPLVPTLQSITARARNVAGGFGTTRNSNVGGGGANGTDLVNLNNIAPTFADNGTTFPVGQLAFKGVEAGSQDTDVNDFDTLVYSDPTGTDFTIGSPAVFAQDKPITCANPGDYNDSATNFRIVAARAANDSAATFSKTIEVADVAPVVTVTQPATRLRSGGADGTATQAHVITATSDQNMAAAPDVVIGVALGGTFVGGGFVGGPKVYTRTLNVDDADAKGTGAWTLSVPVLNNAGTAASIVGTQNNGGFVARTLTFGAFQTNTAMGVEVVDLTKLTAGVFTQTTNPALKQPIGTSPPVIDGFTIDALAINPTDVIWLDTVQVGANGTGLATITDVEETV